MQKSFIFFLPLCLIFTGCQSSPSKSSSPPKTSEVKKEINILPFAWPFLQPKAMESRGGTTRGEPVKLVTTPHELWMKLREPKLSTFEKDRRAILAMAGDYRASFQFVETAGFTDNYTPSKPYFSWGTEHVAVIEDKKDFISLQHTLVMYFRKDSGEVEGPFHMKHWRQDWKYEDSELFTYQGDGKWKKSKETKNLKGSWTQSVFQVDDSPRYEVRGRWIHKDNSSAWQSKTLLRPLPRREYSVRDDYNLLKGEHRITLTPTGWVHEQHNRKVSMTDKSKKAIAQEIGINRYERISSPDLSLAEKNWEKTSSYWGLVRKAWEEVYKEHNSFKLQTKYDGKSLYQIHFAHAAEVEKAELFDEKVWKKKIHNTIHNFLVTK